MRILLLLLLLYLSCNSSAQMDVSLGEMTWTCEKENDYLIMELYAPTKGWVGVGFNNKNSIEHSDLLLFHVVDGRVKSTDLYVKHFGDPKKDVSIGGTEDIEIITFKEDDEGTTIKFRRLWKGKDAFDYQLKNGEAFWLILAYSTHDEFGHHSRMRKHKKLTFNVE